MSGHKRATISISQEEYQRLLDLEVQQRALSNLAPAQPDPSVVQQSQAAIEESYRWMAERHDYFTSVMDRYDGEIRNIEATTSQALARQQQSLFQELDGLAGAVGQQIDQLLKDIERNTGTQIRMLQDTFFQEMAGFEQRLSRLDDAGEMKQALAEYWLDAATDLYRLVDESYHHAFFAPNELDQQSQQIELARLNLGYGLAEASVAASQQAYLQLMDTRVRLEQAEAEWVVVRQAAFEAVQAAYTSIDQRQEVQAIDLDGNNLDQTLQVDYWSGGAWSILAEEFIQTIAPLRSLDPPPSVEWMQDLLNHYLPAAQNQLADVCFHARVEALNSQLRVNIADLVVQALSGYGYHLDRSEYDQQDWRRSFQAELTNLDHSTVTIQVVPSLREEGVNELHLISETNPLYTQRELRQRWAEVENLLVDSGLAVGDYQVVQNQALRPQQVQQRKALYRP